MAAIVSECKGMERDEGGSSEMTNSDQLEPLGLNIIVVAERGHYWKWLVTLGAPVE